MDHFEAIQATASHHNSPVINEPVIYPPSNNTGVPSKLKDWYSNQVFRTVTFFIMMATVLGVTTTAFFTGRLTSDQFLGVVSSLLFLATPSPLQGKKNKKVYYLNGRETVA